MVFFTCNHCGSSLKKNKVEKHYATECRANPSLSCMDCLKDFYGEEYNSHTKCITEDQKYSGKPLSTTAALGKGEKKQLLWLETVRHIIETKGSSLTSQERTLLENMKDFENIPRKKKKFENFVKNVMKRFIDQRAIDGVWALLEEHKTAVVDLNKKVDSKVVEEGDDKGLGEKTSSDKNLDENDMTPKEMEVGPKKKLKRNANSKGADEAEGENQEQVTSKKRKRKATENVEMLEMEHGNVGEEVFVNNGEAKVDGEDDLCAEEDSAKLSKKEKRERKKKQRYEEELKSIASNANVLSEEIDATPEVEDISKSKKTKIKKNKEKSDIGNEVGNSFKNKEKKRKNRENQNGEMDSGKATEDQNDNEKEEITSNGTTEKGAVDSVDESCNKPKGKFKWEKTIVSALQSAPENELLVKRLRKKVLAEYQEWQECTASHGITLEEAFGTFDRKLHRIPAVKILKDRVKLITVSE